MVSSSAGSTGISSTAAIGAGLAATMSQSPFEASTARNRQGARISASTFSMSADCGTERSVMDGVTSALLYTMR